MWTRSTWRSRFNSSIRRIATSAKNRSHARSSSIHVRCTPIAFASASIILNRRTAVRVDVASTPGRGILLGNDRRFRLLAADVYEVLGVERLEGFTRLPVSTTIRALFTAFVDSGLVSLRLIAERLNKAELLDEVLQVSLQLLDEQFGFHIR